MSPQSPLPREKYHSETNERGPLGRTSSEKVRRHHLHSFSFSVSPWAGDGSESALAWSMAIDMAAPLVRLMHQCCTPVYCLDKPTHTACAHCAYCAYCAWLAGLAARILTPFFSIQHLSRHIFSIQIFLYTFSIHIFSIQHVFFYTTFSIHIFLYTIFYTTHFFSIQLDPSHFLTAICCFTQCFHT